MAIKYGTRDVCQHCGQDIEYRGINGWRDRGGNRLCVPYVDKTKGEIIKPKTKHSPPFKKA